MKLELQPQCRARGVYGARHPRLGEPLIKVETYLIQWRDPRVDLAELAKLRWIEGYSRKQLAEKYGKTTVAIQNYFQELKRLGFRISGLSEKERMQILKHFLRVNHLKLSDHQ